MKSLPEKNLVDSETINRFYEEKIIEIDPELILNKTYDLIVNSYHQLSTYESNQSAIVRFRGKNRFDLVESNIRIDKIKPKDFEQVCLFDALKDPSIKILVVEGCAGAGKTYISLCWALLENLKSKDKDKERRKLMLTKPTATVGVSKFFGAVPGGTDEKFAPFLDSFEIHINKILTKEYASLLQERGEIFYKPVEFCRGDSYEDTILIADEMQNLPWHETKTLLTRIGDNSKAILLGDITQKDIDKKVKSGIELLTDSRKFEESEITCYITLSHDYRGPISKLIQLVDDEISK